MESEDPFVFCCENALPPVLGLHNVYATITTMPMWIVPLVPLRSAIRERTSPAIILWLCVLTLLFVAGTVQHAVGPGRTPAVLDPVPLGISQNALLLGCLVKAPMAFSALLAAVPVATAAFWPSQRRMVCSVMDAVLSPCVIGIMARRAWTDASSWRLFIRALASFVGLLACTALEPKLCGLPSSELFHAIAVHLALTLLFGNVSTLALRVLNRDKVE